MSKILVTGGLGYVGSRACPLLLERGHTVRALDLALYGVFGLDDQRRIMLGIETGVPALNGSMVTFGMNPLSGLHS